MATPTDKSVQEEDEVRTEEVDPAKPTVQDLNQMRTSGETMERGSTSVASDQNPFFLPPQEDTLTLLGGIQYGTEEETFGLLGFSSTVPSKLCDDQERFSDAYCLCFLLMLD